MRERAKDAVEGGGKALCVGGIEDAGVVEVDGFIVANDVARRGTTRPAQLGRNHKSTHSSLLFTTPTTTMSLTTTTTAHSILRQSSRLTRTALLSPCRRLLVAHFAAPNPCPVPLLIPSRRTFVSTHPRRAAFKPTPITTQAVLRRSPTAEDIENAELDVQLLAQTDARLAITECAAEVRHYFIPLCQHLLIRVSSNSVESAHERNIPAQLYEFQLSRVVATDISTRWS